MCGCEHHLIQSGGAAVLEPALASLSVEIRGMLVANAVRAAKKAVNSGLGELDPGCWLCSG